MKKKKDVKPLEVQLSESNRLLFRVSFCTIIGSDKITVRTIGVFESEALANRCVDELLGLDKFEDYSRTNFIVGPSREDHRYWDGGFRKTYY